MKKKSAFPKAKKPKDMSKDMFPPKPKKKGRGPSPRGGGYMSGLMKQM